MADEPSVRWCGRDDAHPAHERRNQFGGKDYCTGMSEAASGSRSSRKEREMSDAREALVAALRHAADRCCQCTDGHHDQVPPYGTDDDVRISRDDARKIADILAAGWTPPGERVKPSVVGQGVTVEQEAATAGGALDVPWYALDSLTQGLCRQKETDRG